MIKNQGSFALLGVSLSGRRRFAVSDPSVPTNAVAYEISPGQYEPERTDSDEVIIYENNK